MKITVVGMGKIGLPLAAQYASKGHQVVGVDVNQSVVNLINSAVEPFPGEAHLADYLAESVPSGLLRATTEYSDAVPNSDAVVVAVPLFVDSEGKPDFSIMDSATTSIGEQLTGGTLVSFETTLPVGSTRSRLAPILEDKSGLTEGHDFHAVFSPERVLTGRVFEDLRKYPKLVGGLSERGAKEAVRFYEAVLEFDDRPDLDQPNGVWDLGSAEASEMAKLAETTYRDVNIALANQFAKFAESAGIDVHKVIEASNSQPYSHIHRPGVAVGGHCIPVYPRLYLSNDPDAEIVAVARKTNESMPRHVVERLERELGGLEGQRVVVLGAAYRGDVKEAAFSGVFRLVEELSWRGATVMVHDPMYSSEELSEMGFESFELGDVADAAILHSDHSEYSRVEADDLLGVQVVVDGRKIQWGEFSLETTLLTIGVG